MSNIEIIENNMEEPKYQKSITKLFHNYFYFI